MISLLLLDIEGVLALPGGAQYPWPLDDWSRLRAALAEAPWATALCSGRQSPYGEAVIQALDIYHPLPDATRQRIADAGGPPFLAWPSILENGAYFYDPLGKNAYPHPAITPERLKALQRLRSEVLAPLARATSAVVEAGKDFSISVNPPLVDPNSGERQSTDTFRPIIEEAAAEYMDVIEIKHSRSAVDITPKGIGKASALRQLLAWTGLSGASVAGVGDTVADAEWLALVGWSAAPANGRAALPGMRFYAGRETAAGLLEIVRFLRREARIDAKGSPERDRQSHSILVVDDEKTFADVMARALKLAGYAAQAETSPVQAMQLAQKLRPTLVVVDWKMSGETYDGLELLYNLRVEPETADIPVVLLTYGSAWYDHSRFFSQMSFGPDAMISKPFNPSELVNTIDELLGIY